MSNGPISSKSTNIHEKSTNEDELEMETQTEKYSRRLIWSVQNVFNIRWSMLFIAELYRCRLDQPKQIGSRNLAVERASFFPINVVVVDAML